MPTTAKSNAHSDRKIKFPVVCKSWDEVDTIVRKYLKPVRFGPKGQPIYDHAEVTKLVIFPQDK
jgi:hypothetical protein